MKKNMLGIWLVGAFLCSIAGAGGEGDGLDDQELIRLMSQSPGSTGSQSPRPLSAGICDEVNRSPNTLSLAEYLLGINGENDKIVEGYLSEGEGSAQRVNGSGVIELTDLAKQSFQRKQKLKEIQEAENQKVALELYRDEERRQEVILELHQVTEANPLLGWSLLVLRCFPCFSEPGS